MSEGFEDTLHAGPRRFRSYPAYKASGVDWLGEIPEDWEVKPLKRLARLGAGSSNTSAEIERTGDYPVFGGNGVRGYTSSFTHEGEFPLIGRQGALCGCVNFTSGKFWASEHAVVADPEAGVDPRWLADLLRAMSLNSYSESAAQPGLAVETVAALPVPAPPFEHQRAIAHFLDRETAKIDALVAKKERAKTSMQMSTRLCHLTSILCLSTKLRPGDILMSRANTRQLLGSAVLVRRVRPRLLLCDKPYRIRANSERVLSEFVVRLKRVPAGK